MRKTIAGILARILLVTVVAAGFAAETAPEVLVKSTVDEVLAVMKQHRDKQAMRRIAEQKVVQHFDFREMTRAAMGRSWQQANPTQQQALESAFRTLLVNVYSQALGREGAGNAIVEVKPARAQPGQDEVTVKTVVRDGNRPPVPIDYHMARTAGAWKVNDVIVENMSLVASYRGTFAEEVSRSGIDGLIRTLDAKNRAAQG